LKFPRLFCDRDLLCVTLHTSSKDEYILDTISCDDILPEVKTKKGCVRAYMRGRHHVRRLSADVYDYTWISQVDFRGCVPSWILKFTLNKLGTSVADCCKMLYAADLEEENMTTFKKDLRLYGVKKDIKRKYRSRSTIVRSTSNE